jgi:hypothetical protein
VRSSLKAGAKIAAVTLAIEVLAVLPGRIALAGAQARLGRSPTEFVVAGACRDISDLAVPVGAVGLIALGIAMLVRRKKSESVSWRTSMRVLTATIAVTSVLVYFISSMAAEFKIDRGVDATLFDLYAGKGWSNPFATIVAFMMLRRHLLPGIFALAAACAVFVLFYRRVMKAAPIPKRAPMLVSFGVVSVLGYLLALIPLDPHVRVFRTITDRHVVGEPFMNLFATFGESQENVHLGMKGLIERAHFSAAQSRGGEALLGLPARDAAPNAAGGADAKIDCASHPFARAFPNAGVEDAMPGALGHHAIDADAQETLALLEQLSAELYAGRSTPIDLWQVMLESFRADDLHALSPAAPRAVTPFVNSLYEVAAGATRPENEPADTLPLEAKARLGRGAVIGFRNVWQSGSRTSQGLSSYMCGLGMLPYGLSATRDFGQIPLRCVPDVLIDAGFVGAFFYGGSPSFDEMDTFLLAHGFHEIVGQMQMPASLPTSEVGVSDRAIVGHSTALLGSRTGAGGPDATRARYVLIMSGSNHIPYRRPDDLPPEIESRVDAIIEHTKGFAGTSDDAARLRTFAYTDQALAELLTSVEKSGGLDRTIFVFGADHATAEPFVWPTSDSWSIDAAHARIPFVIVLPEPLIEKSAHPDVVRDLVQKLNAAINRRPWAQNDTPLLLLTLLSKSPGMQALVAENRWHTLGGARTSPFFTPPREDVAVVGIDCKAEFFGTNARGESVLPRERASFVKNADEMYTVSPTLIPIAASLSRFFNGYANACGGEKLARTP